MNTWQKIEGTDDEIITTPEGTFIMSNGRIRKVKEEKPKKFKDKDPKTFIVRHHGNTLHIETDHTKLHALDALLSTIVREWNRANPDKADAWFHRLSEHYRLAKAKENPPAQDPEMEKLDFAFWDWIMRLAPHDPGLNEP